MKTIISIIISLILIVGAIFFTRLDFGGKDIASVRNVSIDNNQQIIEIKAKGGYTPRRSIATAGLPTTLRFLTEGTFDCSAIVIIPSLGVNQNLAISGSTDIDLSIPAEGVLRGSCGMGMFPFEIEFTALAN